MQQHWRRHWWILGALLLSCFLVWGLDQRLFGPDSHGWVRLDLRGVLLGPYLLLVAVFAAITTIIIAQRASTAGTMTRVYLATGVALALVAGAVFLVWRSAGTEQLQAGDNAQQDTATALSNSFEIIAWHADESSMQIIVSLRRSFDRIDVDIEAMDADGALVASGNMSKQNLSAGIVRLEAPASYTQAGGRPQWQLRIRLEAGGDVASLDYASETNAAAAVGDGALVTRLLDPPTAPSSFPTSGESK